MKKMKMILMTAILGIASLSLVTSCNTDQCKGVVCENGGVCSDLDGSCDCPVGYEGNLCETVSKSKFIKNWSASDKVTGSTTPIVYSCVIADGADIQSVVIANTFRDDYFQNAINATVSGNVISIPNQQPDNDGYAISGSGTYNDVDGTISWSYTITEVATVLTVDHTGQWN